MKLANIFLPPPHPHAQTWTHFFRHRPFLSMGHCVLFATLCSELEMIYTYLSRWALYFFSYSNSSFSFSVRDTILAPFQAFIRGLLKMFFCHTHDLIGSAILPIKQKSDTLVDAAIEISRFLFLPHADVPSSSEPLGFFASVLWLIRKQTKRNGGLRVVASGCNSNTTLK